MVGDDIFSLGSLVYFIMMGEYPYGDVPSDVPSDEVERLYGVQQFPDVDGVDWGDVVMRCWRREVDSAEVVYGCLMTVERERSSI